MAKSLPPLPRSFYERAVEQVARESLGKLLVRRVDRTFTIGRIVEAEAYLHEGDSASHSAKGLNKKNAAMFGPAGHAYVYVIHARHCVNLVTAREGIASAVLIRAVEPLQGIPCMQARRQRDSLLDLTRGPARLCEAFAIDRTLNHHDLTLGKQLWLAEDESLVSENLAVETSRRIGVTSAEELLLRFYLRDNRFVSRMRTT